MSDLKNALQLSLPVLGVYWFLGASYGLLASSMGYPVWISLGMAMAVYSGSVEFIGLTILCGAYQPIAALSMALVVGARHIFYGISMLERWRNAGWYKPFLIFWMSDETFAINYANGGTFRQQLWLSLLDYIYWISGGLMGYFLGSMLSETVMENMRGMEFVVTAMFVAIFMDDYVRNRKTHLSAWIGICTAVLCLLAFGTSKFIIPTMVTVLGVLYYTYRMEKKA